MARCPPTIFFPPIENEEKYFGSLSNSDNWKKTQKTESQFANKETDLQFVVSLGFVFHCFPLYLGDKKWHWKRWSKENITSHIFRPALATASHPHIYTSSEFGPLAPTRKAFVYALLSTSVNIKSFLGYSGVKIVLVSVLNKAFRRFLFGFNYDSLSYRSEGLLALSCWDIKGPFVQEFRGRCELACSSPLGCGKCRDRPGGCGSPALSASRSWDAISIPRRSLSEWCLINELPLQLSVRKKSCLFHPWHAPNWESLIRSMDRHQTHKKTFSKLLRFSLISPLQHSSPQEIQPPTLEFLSEVETGRILSP